MTLEFLTLADRRLAYQRQNGRKDAPGILFLGGYASDMTGTKAGFLAERCAEATISFLRFDYGGNGQSSGDFKDGTIGSWLDDSLAVFDQLTEGPQILVGSSMGGWLALLLAMRRTERIAAFVGIAAAPDFTQELVWEKLRPEQREVLERDGLLYDEHAPPDHNVPMTLKLITEARQHLLLHQVIPVSCPMRLLQGMQDKEVPWHYAMRISRNVTSDDVRVSFIKDGDHRLNRPQDLGFLWQTVTALLPQAA